MHIYRADGTGVGLTAGDDSVVGGPKTPQQIAAQKRLQQTQAQVDEVCTSTTIMSFICNLLYYLMCYFRSWIL